jgi:hypothetical protein
MRRLCAALSLVALLAGCAAVREPARAPADARMAQAASVAGVAEEAFGRLPWGRQGEFSLHGQRVRYERGAERLALFDALPAGVATPLRLSWAAPAGDSAAVCEGWTPAASAASRNGGPRPWVLSCRWGSAPAAMLQIGEGQPRGGLLSREGAYRRGELTLGLRSAHQLEGVARAQSTAVGYEMLHQGTVVATLDLSGPLPRLRRPDPGTPLGRAVTEAALALALVSDAR